MLSGKADMSVVIVSVQLLVNFIILFAFPTSYCPTTSK